MSDGRQLRGQQYDTDKNIVRPYTQQMMDKTHADTLVGNARTEISPNDRDSSEVKVFDDVTNAILGITHIFTSYVNLSGKLPDVLLALSITYNEVKGEGQYTEDAFGSSGGSASSALAFNLSGSAQSSYTVTADVNALIKSYFATNYPATNYMFFLATDPTQANVIARLALPPFSLTVLPWPSFRPQRHTLTITGQQMDINVRTKIDQAAGASVGNSYLVQSKGRGFALSGGSNIRTIELPPTIHNAIQFQGETDKVATVSATSATTIVGGQNFPSAQEVLTKASPMLRASVRPTILAGTSPTSVPTSGLYLLDVISAPDELGLMKVQAVVVDFTGL